MNTISRIKENAFWRYFENFGYNYTERITLWKSDIVSWCNLSISYGIRRSKRVQYFPIWNTSNNCTRSLLFGLGFWMIEFSYNRKKSFNQKQWIPFRRNRWVWKTFQLLR